MGTQKGEGGGGTLVYVNLFRLYGFKRTRTDR